MADAADSKSVIRKDVRVQVPRRVQGGELVRLPIPVSPGTVNRANKITDK